MGFPVKVPEEIYARIKERAEREGISYQEALVRLIAEPQAALEEARREREELRAQVAELAQRVAALEGATAKAETSLKAMDKKITGLAQKSRSSLLTNTPNTPTPKRSKSSRNPSKNGAKSSQISRKQWIPF